MRLVANHATFFHSRLPLIHLSSFRQTVSFEFLELHVPQKVTRLPSGLGGINNASTASQRQVNPIRCPPPVPSQTPSAKALKTLPHGTVIIIVPPAQNRANQFPLPGPPGLIFAASLLLAAGIAFYENENIRQWLDNYRQRIAIALHSLGDDISPAAPAGRQRREEEERRRRRTEIVRRNQAELVRRAREEGVAVDLDELVAIARDYDERHGTTDEWRGRRDVSMTLLAAMAC